MFVLNFDKVPTSVFSSFNNMELSLGSRVEGETDSASKRRRCPISGGFIKNTWQRRNLQRGIFCLWEFNSIFLKGMYNSFREISIYQQIMELTCKFLFFFNIFILYWSIADLQCCIVSGVQQSDSVIHIHISILLKFFSHLGYYRPLSRIPCAIE